MLLHDLASVTQPLAQEAEERGLDDAGYRFKMAARMAGNERKRKLAIQDALELLDSSSDISNDEESIYYTAVVHILNKRLVCQVI